MKEGKVGKVRSSTTPLKSLDTSSMRRFVAKHHNQDTERAYLLGEQHGKMVQYLQDKERLIRRATTIPAEDKPHNYAHEGRVVVIPEEDWQAFIDMETG